MISFIEQYEHPAEPYELNPDWFLRDGLELALLAGNPACRGSGTWIDVSPRGNHGQFQNTDPATDWVHDGERAALDFDGVNDYVATVKAGSDSVPAGSHISVACWANHGPGTTNEYQGLVSVGLTITNPYGGARTATTPTQWRWGVNVNGVWKDVSAPPQLHSTNEWQLVCATYDGVDLKIFVDGELGNTLNAPGTLQHQNNQPTTVGLNGINYFYGQIDLALVASRAWTPDEIRRLYEETKPGGYGTMLRPSCTPVCVRG